MATIYPTFTAFPEPGNPKAAVIQWGPMKNGDVGAAYPWLFDYADRSVQVTGTFGSGGVVNIEGSNDMENFYTLSSPNGNSLSVVSASLNAIVEMSLGFRPRVTAGDLTTSLTVTMIARRTTPGL